MSGALRLNQDCRCWPIEPGRVSDALPESVRTLLDERHHHLFANTGVFLPAADLQAMSQQIAAIETVAQLPDYQAQSHNLTQSQSARVGDQIVREPREQAGTRGVFMGYDFHLTEQGPRLIEINTNAGGAFFATHLQRTLSLASESIDSLLVQTFQQEWELAGRSGSPNSIAIVDDNPQSQYLYGDMQLARVALRERFTNVFIVNSADLQWDGEALRLRDNDIPIDVVYNRLTDFELVEPSSAALASAWQQNAVVLTPSPRHHALLANKLNLQILSDENNLARWDLNDVDRAALKQLPRVVQVSTENADTLWQARKSLFFKPAAGFGSRAAYRGAKLSKRVWSAIVSDAQTQPYVAQTLVPPSKRLLMSEASAVGPHDLAQSADRKLKFDLRVYSYAAQPLLLAARAYEGQTTNFRTVGGGFAPVAMINGDDKWGC